MKPRNPKFKPRRHRQGTISPRPVSFINNDPPAPTARPGEEFDKFDFKLVPTTNAGFIVIKDDGSTWEPFACRREIKETGEENYVTFLETWTLRKKDD